MALTDDLTYQQIDHLSAMLDADSEVQAALTALGATDALFDSYPATGPSAATPWLLSLHCPDENVDFASKPHSGQQTNRILLTIKRFEQEGISAADIRQNDRDLHNLTGLLRRILYRSYARDPQPPGGNSLWHKLEFGGGSGPTTVYVRAPGETTRSVTQFTLTANRRD